MAEQEKKKLLNRGKKYSDRVLHHPGRKKWTVQEGFQALLSLSYARFDETVDVAFNLGVDPKHADQMVRGALVLPQGTGKTVRVAVLAKGDKAKEAAAAGADVVGAEDLIEKITGGWLEFDRMIATPDMMVALSKIGKILGPRGLMPNPKLGTVTVAVTQAVQEQKLGKVEYKTDKTGIVHVGIGKKSFGADRLRENYLALAATLVRAKPHTSKGTYLKKISLSTTMSPSLTLDPQETLGAVGF